MLSNGDLLTDAFQLPTVGQQLVLLAGEKPDDDRPASVLASRSVPDPVPQLHVRLGHWNPDRIGEDLAALSDGNGSGLWLVGSGFRDVVDPDIPVAAVLLCVVLRSSERISPFPSLVQLVEQVGICLFHSGEPASLSLSPSLSIFASRSSKQFSSERWWCGGETMSSP